MNKLILTILLFTSGTVLAQSNSAVWGKKLKGPFVSSSNDTVWAGDQLYIKEGTKPDGGFKYIQLTSVFNEPLQPADSRFAYKKIKVKFFKEQQGTALVFASGFCINIEAALKSGEVELVKDKNQ